MPVQLTGRADNDNADPTPARESCPRREAWVWLFAALLAVAVPLTGVASLPGEDDGLTAAKAISREVRRGGGWVVTSEMEIERKFLVAELPDLKRQQGGGDRAGLPGARRRRGRRGGAPATKAGRPIADHQGGFGTDARRGGDRARSRALRVAVAADRGPPVGKDATPDPLRGARDRARSSTGETSTACSIAEVEFPDEETADAFEPPEWFDEEVTGNKTYLNETLATKGLPR